MNILTCSGLDSNKDFRRTYGVQIVPLKITLEHEEFVDDEQFDAIQFLDKMSAASEAPKTSCPSPQDFIARFSKDVANFVVTLSSQLSGTYNSALMAKEMFEEENEGAVVHVIDSMSAGAGGVPIVMKINELKEKGFSDSEIAREIKHFVDNMKTMFVIDSLENLAKAGRMHTVVEKIATMLDIKPVMQGVNGQIKMLKKVRGYKRAMKALVEEIGNSGVDFENRILSISHCNNLEKAQLIKDEIKSSYNFKDIIINQTLGIATVYTGGGGIIVSF